MVPRPRTLRRLVGINKAITYQSPVNTYGAKGAWINLYVAVLAYDPTLHRMGFQNVPAPVQPTGYDCHGSVREEDAAY